MAVLHRVRGPIGGHSSRPGTAKTSRRNLAIDSRADVIVLGAGMVGTSVALHLQNVGRDVVLLDRRNPGRKPATAMPV